MSKVLDIQDARKRFEQTTALDGASLTLDRGEWIGLLGPNGAGKTTLVRAVAGRLRLDGGTIQLEGARLDASSAADATRRRLGVVPQDVALYPLLTARENLAIFGALHGVRGKALRRRVDRALEWTGLADRSREPTKRFSGGMKRRLNIACGVLHEPEVILLDEPTVGVDPQSRQRIWEMLAELRDRGAALLLTTHQLDEAQQVRERIVIIDHGKVIAAGTLDELVRNTIGSGRRVTFSLDRELPAALDDGHFTPAGDRRAVREIDDLASELPRLLEQLRSAGATLTDLHIEAPTLQNVFIHLTGRELRE